MKLCKDCKWFEPYKYQDRLDLSTCLHPRCYYTGKPCPVTGEPSRLTGELTCETARQFIIYCGADAKYFEKAEHPWEHTPSEKLTLTERLWRWLTHH